MWMRKNWQWSTYGITITLMLEGLRKTQKRQLTHPVSGPGIEPRWCGMRGKCAKDCTALLRA